MSKCYQTEFGVVELADEVLETLNRHRQLESISPEAGGQLFARFEADRMRILRATEPTLKSRRGRTYFWPSRRDEQREIESLYAEGLHYVGDWHSHPEPYPEPSSDDIEKIEGIYAKSKHDLNCIVMLIVGTSDEPEGIWFGSASKAGVHQAERAETRPADGGGGRRERAGVLRSKAKHR
ncbi:Mov34/MPN/PAD-1 family protein [Paraburkholderia sp. J67]|uniref:Mov34/MPN/PAD-1 family protein n=1 Tax=Paraburkholderia sp. J67 TaxID=2805435 RepID=UPI002ABE0E65|nr:Mov34/MPN/PAD-1 family protein [Paraburkholderia sp. J67]